MKTNQNQNQNTFETLLRTYEHQATNRTPRTEHTFTTALQELATATAYSVLKKCIETSQNQTLVKVKRDIARDTALLSNTRYAQENATALEYTQNGDIVQIVLDKDLHNALTKLCAETLGEGVDLVQDAILSIMEETKKAKERNGNTFTENFMEQPYTARRLKRKVWIKVDESANGWETITTTPIQEIFKAVRRAVENSRAVQTDPKNGYTYISHLVTDEQSGECETVYRRMPKYADLGGAVKDFNGKETAYTADEQTAQDMDELVARLNLSKRQAEILKLRLCGYGKKAIATYLGIDPNNTARVLKQIQTKATAIGFTPCTK